MAKIKIDKEKVGGIFEHYPKESAILLTTDDNAFLAHGTGKNMCRDHCQRVNATFAVLTREAFENGVEEIETSEEKRKESATKELTSNKPSGDDKSKTKEEKEAERLKAFEEDWTTGKFMEIVEFAKSKGLEATTTKYLGTEKLIEEVKTFLASLEIGANDVTNHKTQAE